MKPLDLRWTDDTSMALFLATSLGEKGGFDARDQMERYCRCLGDLLFRALAGHSKEEILGTVVLLADRELRRCHPERGKPGR